MPPRAWTPIEPVAEPEVVDLGYVSGVFGVRGEVRLFLHNRDAEWLGRRQDVLLCSDDGVWFRVAVVTRRGSGKRILGRFEGVDSREQAAGISGWRVLLRVSDLPTIAQDEFYVRDVVGLPVFVGRECVGRVVQVHRSGPVDIFELCLQEDVRFVPALRRYVRTVDVEGRRLELEPAALEESE